MRTIYFAEIGAGRVSRPSNIVFRASAISTDKMLQAACSVTPMQHRYRLGTHYEAFSGECATLPVRHYHKTVPMRSRQQPMNPDAY